MMNRVRFARALSLLAPVVAPAFAQSPSVVYDILGEPGAILGTAVAAAGDVDADGRPDFMYSDYFGNTRVHSGATGELIHAASGPAIGTVGDIDGDGHDEFVAGPIRCGRSGEPFIWPTGFPASTFSFHIAQVGDVDGDGIEDFVSGFPGLSVRCAGDVITISVFGPARVVTFSAADGNELEAFGHSDRATGFGAVLEPLGDLDGDGLPELAVGTMVAANNNFNCWLPFGQSIFVRSPRTGRAFWSAPLAATSLARLDDVDGDGFDDLAVGLPFQDGVEFRSGATGALLFAVEDSAPFDYWGVMVERIADVNDDGFADLLVSTHQPTLFPVGAPGNPTVLGPGRVDVVSGQDGEKLASIEGDGDGSLFGRTLASLGDVNGDGAPEFVVGAPFSQVGGAAAGRVQVISTRPVTRTGASTGASAVTLAPGAAARMQRDAGSGPLGGRPGSNENASEVAELRVPPGLSLAMAGRTVVHAVLLVGETDEARWSGGQGTPVDPTGDPPFLPLRRIESRPSEAPDESARTPAGIETIGWTDSPADPKDRGFSLRRCGACAAAPQGPKHERRGLSGAGL